MTLVAILLAPIILGLAVWLGIRLRNSRVARAGVAGGYADAATDLPYHRKSKSYTESDTSDGGDDGDGGGGD